MRTINQLDTYQLGERRRDEPERLEQKLMICSAEGSYCGAYVTIRLEGDEAIVVLGQQVKMGAKNAANAVRDCMLVKSVLDSFDAVPTSYEARQKVQRSTTTRVILGSTAAPSFVRVSLSYGSRLVECTVRVDEVLAAVENASRT